MHIYQSKILVLAAGILSTVSERRPHKELCARWSGEISTVV